MRDELIVPVAVIVGLILILVEFTFAGHEQKEMMTRCMELHSPIVCQAALK